MRATADGHPAHRRGTRPRPSPARARRGRAARRRCRNVRGAYARGRLGGDRKRGKAREVLRKTVWREDSLRGAVMEKFIVLLRHGIAEPRGSAPEETRPLTEEGHAKMKEIGRGLHALFPKAEAIITSPLTRCMQTAEWVVKAYPNLPLVTSDLLRPEAGGRSLRKLIDATTVGRFIVVGHEPNLTEGMLDVTKMHIEDDLELKKGGC